MCRRTILDSQRTDPAQHAHDRKGCQSDAQLESPLPSAAGTGDFIRRCTSGSDHRNAKVCLLSPRTRNRAMLKGRNATCGGASAAASRRWGLFPLSGPIAHRTDMKPRETVPELWTKTSHHAVRRRAACRVDRGGSVTDCVDEEGTVSNSSSRGFWIRGQQEYQSPSGHRIQPIIHIDSSSAL